MVRLVTYPEVEQDLALTHEQKDALKTISQKVAAYEKRMFAEQTGPPRASIPRENRQWHLQKYEAAYQMLAGARQEIAKTLTPSQMKRLEQISLQDLGAEALFRPDIVQTLNLSQEQRQKLAQIRDETGKELLAMAQRFQQNFLPEGMRPPPRGHRTIPRIGSLAGTIWTGQRDDSIQRDFIQGRSVRHSTARWRTVQRIGIWRRVSVGRRTHDTSSAKDDGRRPCSTAGSRPGVRAEDD